MASKDKVTTISAIASSKESAISHGEFLRSWDEKSALTDEQNEIINTLDASLANFLSSADPTMSSRRIDLSLTTDDFQRKGSAQRSVQTQQQPKRESNFKFDSLEALGHIKNSEDFRAWHEEIEKRLEEANEEKYRNMISGLHEDQHTCQLMSALVEESLDKFSRIKQGRASIVATTTHFQAECETFVAEQKRLDELADTLRKRLNYFEELETLTAKFNSRGKDAISPADKDFLKFLHRLDECVIYASSSTGAVADADGYLARFLELQRRAFTLIKNYVVSSFRATANQVLRELKNPSATGPMQSNELTEASLEYLRFRTIAPRIKSLMTELSSRSEDFKSSKRPTDSQGKKFEIIPDNKFRSMSSEKSHPLYSSKVTAFSMLSECEDVFCEVRRKLLEPNMLSDIKTFSETHDTVMFARSSTNLVMHVCGLEKILFEHFFPVMDSDKPSPALIYELECFCDLVYENLRPRILQENDLDKLVYLIEVLKTEVLSGDKKLPPIVVQVLSKSTARIIADTQERIIYRTEIYIRSEIREFQPRIDQLEYPEIILRSQSADSKAKGRGVSSYSTWYPPVDKTLRLLSMLYRCIDTQVFAGIAQDVVSSCVQSILSAASAMQKRKKPEAVDHALLFQVWQLLMLREQIAPFDVDFAYVEKELDFGELRLMLGKVIRGESSFRNLARPPHATREKVFDSKRELEREVRASCESFILRTTRIILDPILSFLAKCNALPGPGTVNSQGARIKMKQLANTPKVAPLPEAGGNVENDHGYSPKNSENLDNGRANKENAETEPEPLLSPSIKEDETSSASSLKEIDPFEKLKQNSSSFAHIDNVKNIWNKAKYAIETEFVKVVEHLHIYITKPASCAVLLRPVRANFTEATNELLATLQVRYTLEEREQIGINGKRVEELRERIDNAIAGAVSATDKESSIKSSAALDPAIEIAEELEIEKLVDSDITEVIDDIAGTKN